MRLKVIPIVLARAGTGGISVKIVLIGFRGTGKTAVGKALAAQLNIPFLDTDTAIEKREGERISKIFETLGEEYFRKVEREVVASLADFNGVISTGGGVVLNPTNIENLRRGATVFLLSADEERILERISRSDRPPLSNLPLREEVSHLLTMRRPYYTQAADFCLDTASRSVHEICRMIVHIIEHGSIGEADVVYANAFFANLACAPSDWYELEHIIATQSQNPALRICGIVGNPVSQSKSPGLYKQLFSLYHLNFFYGRFQTLNVKDVIDLARRLDFRGLSVTIPFKADVLPLLDEVDKTAQEIGAVNTVVQCSRVLHGYNTDWLGVKIPLEHLKGRRAVILGAGGAAAAAAYACRDLRMDVTILNRTPERGRALADRLGCNAGSLSLFSSLNPDVVINATPLGMGTNQEMPISPATMKPSMTVFDLVYTPPETPLIKAAQQAGCPTIRGIEMFIWQAREQFRLFTGIVAHEERLRSLVS